MTVWAWGWMNMPEPEEQPDEEFELEVLREIATCRLGFIKLGFNEVDAQWLAVAGCSPSRAREMIKGGCTVALCAKIML